MADFYVATEDLLGRALAEKLAAAAGHGVADFIPRDIRRHGGFGGLKKRLPEFVRASAAGLPFLILTDLDDTICAPVLIDQWFQNLPKPRTLSFRVAVRESEAWVMADRAGFARWMGLDHAKVPLEPESEQDPKSKLLALANASKHRELRDGIVARPGSVARQGLRYNEFLGKFVRDGWNIDAAAESAPSLRRAIDRLIQFPA